MEELVNLYWGNSVRTPNLFEKCLLSWIFRKEPFFYGHDNYDQLVKIAKTRIIRLNASYYLKTGHFVISIKANSIDSTVPAETVFAREFKKLVADEFKPFEQVTLDPFECDHVVNVALILSISL
ncbi:hypothetical protein RIF29_25960 [Crotalaria pallida]|uniref:Uncharacterized protein n=1 Tax=Crotalaria pallida TaxID=3830 RepID=A0AAN9I041_CROPI